jgi:hypothetical protein
MVELIKVYMVESTIGKGIEGDPCRTLREIFTIEGERLGEIDNIKIE